jgi:hypothetical protein
MDFPEDYHIHPFDTGPEYSKLKTTQRSPAQEEWDPEAQVN